jgi:hypothetical protein
MTEPTTQEATATDPAPAQDDPVAAAKAEADQARAAGDDLATLRAEARKWEAQAKANKAAADELKKLQDADKTESQKLAEDREAHKSRAEQAEGELMRLRVGLRKNLTEAQAKRLIGTTEEELEADADELLATFGAQPSGEAPVSTTRPTENLRGGGNPDTDPEPDLKKVLSDIPRR